MSYAILAYYSAYLKYYYPIEYFAAVLTTFSSKTEKTSLYIKDANRHGIKVLPPDINTSEREFSINENNEIVFGFGAIQSLKGLSIDNIIEQRPFNSFQDLFSKLNKSALDKASVQALVLSGAMDNLSESDNRMEILAEVFAARGDTPTELVIQEIPKFTNAKKLMYEKKYLGLFLTGHPLEGVAHSIDFEEMMSTNNLFTTMAIVNNIKRIITKKGDPMAFIQLSFLEREVDAVCFPNLWQSDIQIRKSSAVVALADIIKETLYVKVTGRFEEEDGSFIITRLDIPYLLNKEHADYFNAVELEKGFFPEVAEEIVAPRVSFNDLIGF